MIRKFANRGLGLALIICFNPIAKGQNSFNPINDSTEARYRYKVHEYEHAELPAGTDINEIDWSERDLLKPSEKLKEVCIGVNSSKEQYFQIKNLISFELEDWMYTPNLQLLTPTGCAAYDSTGEQIFYFTHNPVQQNDIDDINSTYLTDGFQPIMMLFPNKHSDLVEEAKNDGALFTEVNKNVFTLSKGEHYLEIRADDLEIIERDLQDSVRTESHVKYTLFAPYGYVPVWEKEKRTRTSLPVPVTFVTTSVYSDHVIEDLVGEIEKYTDQAHLEVFPSPVTDEYEIVLVGIPEAQVSSVQVRDHMGNIVQTHKSPTVDADIISLNASAYPSGPLILIVNTSQGIFTESIQKVN